MINFSEFKELSLCTQKVYIIILRAKLFFISLNFKNILEARLWKIYHYSVTFVCELYFRVHHQVCTDLKSKFVDFSCLLSLMNPVERKKGKNFPEMRKNWKNSIFYQIFGLIWTKKRRKMFESSYPKRCSGSTPTTIPI